METFHTWLRPDQISSSPTFILSTANGWAPTEHTWQMTYVVKQEETFFPQIFVQSCFQAWRRRQCERPTDPFRRAGCG